MYNKHHRLFILGIHWSPMNVDKRSMITWKRAPGPRLNIKTVLSTYGDFHVKDKTAVLSLTWELPYLVRPSFLLRRPPGLCIPSYYHKFQVSIKIIEIFFQTKSENQPIKNIVKYDVSVSILDNVLQQNLWFIILEADYDQLSAKCLHPHFLPMMG